MKPLAFIRVKEKGMAIQAAESKDARFIGGGTNLVDLMKFGVERPEKLVDINALPMSAITPLPDGGLRIGALVRNSDLAYDPLVRERYPVLSEALLSGASPQLRNMATVGGNLLQRTRCPYFCDIVFPCNKREPGSGCPAMNGYNRSHAILGGSDDCIATHPSDMCVALAVLDTTIHVQGMDGSRTIPFAGFHRLPGNTPHVETSLMPGELITAIDLPALSYGKRSHYLKVRDRASYEFALASAAVVLDMEGGTIHTARIALGGIGTRPWRSTEAEQVLKGQQAGKAIYQAAAEMALQDAKPHTYNAFKPELAKRTLVSALTTTGGMI